MDLPQSLATAPVPAVPNRGGEARTELDAGLYEINAWIDNIGPDHELPVPATRHR